jgi:hypothetical protein
MAMSSLGFYNPLFAPAFVAAGVVKYFTSEDDEVVDVASPDLPPDPVYTQPAAPPPPPPKKSSGGGYVAPTPAAPPPPPVESSGLSGLQMAAIGIGLAAVGAVVWKFKKRGGFSRNSHNEECDLCTATFEDLGRLARVSARRATLSRTASACLTGGTVRHPLGTTVRRGQTAASTSRSLCRTRLARTPLRGAEDLLPNLEPSRQTPCRSREGPPSRVSHRTSGRRA